MARAWDLKSLQTLSDEKLIDLLVDGEILALECLFDRHSGQVFQYLQHQGLSPEEARLQTLHIFTQVYEQRFLLQEGRGDRHWLYELTRSQLPAPPPPREEDEAPFLRAGNLPAIEGFSEVRRRIQRQGPPMTQVILKMLGIYIIASFISLLICPQFGLRLYFQGHGLLNLFMQAGLQGALLLAGFFFLGTSFLAAALTLDRATWERIRKFRVFFAWGLALLSLFVFLRFGEGVNFQLNLMWLLGAYLGARTACLLPAYNFFKRTSKGK